MSLGVASGQQPLGHEPPGDYDETVAEPFAEEHPFSRESSISSSRRPSSFGQSPPKPRVGRSNTSYSTAEILRKALSELDPVERRTEQRGVWTGDGQTAITERVLEFFANADGEIVYVTAEGLVEALGTAAERDGSIKLVGVSTEVQDRIQDEIPGATTFESLWVWSDTSAGRLTMVDGTRTLVSALVNGADANSSDPRSETATGGEADTNTLVVTLKVIFIWRLETEPPN